MKKLLKMLALWLVKITGTNLVEPYSIEHLKHMIYSVDADYSKFKYKPFLVHLNAIHESGELSIKIPFLVDCINIDDAKKIIENIRNSLNNKGFLTGINTDKDIHTKEEKGLATEEFKEDLERFGVLSGYRSFSQKVEAIKKEIQDSPFFLDVDILTGTSQIKKVSKIKVAAPTTYPGIQISIIDIYPDENNTKE